MSALNMDNVPICVWLTNQTSQFIFFRYYLGKNNRFSYYVRIKNIFQYLQRKLLWIQGANLNRYEAEKPI